jgi:hypothetical protein
VVNLDPGNDLLPYDCAVDVMGESVILQINLGQTIQSAARAVDSILHAGRQPDGRTDMWTCMHANMHA